MGAPLKYTAEQMVEALAATKGLIGPAARRLGCHPDTVRAYARRYTSVASVLREQREEMKDMAELALLAAIQKQEAWAVCFFLKTQAKDRGYVERVEQQQIGGIDVTVTYANSNDPQTD